MSGVRLPKPPPPPPAPLEARTSIELSELQGFGAAEAREAKAFFKRELSPLGTEFALVVGAVVAGLVIYAGLPRLLSAIDSRAAVQARALGGCRVPTEHEQLHIVVRQRDGQIAAECMYVGSRGTYSRRP